MLRTRLLRRAELAAGDLRPDPLLQGLDLADPCSERLRNVRETLAGRPVVTCLPLRLPSAATATRRRGARARGERDPIHA